MTRDRKATKAAHELLRTAWVEDGYITIPVDPVEIAQRLGAKVRDADLEPGVSGALMKEPGSDPVIFLNRSDSGNRRRFSCAHELGHLMSRAGQDEYAFVDYRGPMAGQGTDDDEIFANQFAAALLMPEGAVHQLKDNHSTVGTLAAEFGVSLEAMGWRLQNLGIRQPS